MAIAPRGARQAPDSAVAALEFGFWPVIALQAAVLVATVPNVWASLAAGHLRYQTYIAGSVPPPQALGAGPADGRT